MTMRGVKKITNSRFSFAFSFPVKSCPSPGISLKRGIFLVLWGALVVSSIDNFVRPILIGGQAKISTLFLFFGMIGGIEAYGILGLFLGPALMAAVTAFVEIYREEYVLSAEDPPPERPMRRSRVG